MARKYSHGKEEEYKMANVHIFTNMNKCFPKDDFPLSRINKVVNSVVGCDNSPRLFL
jgi:hypothetical protein